MLLSRSTLYATALSLVGSSLGFELVREHKGSTFFDGWDWFGSWDNLTLSDVWWLDQKAATDQHLAYVNDAGNAIIKVDTTTNVREGENRNTVRLTSKDFYDWGSLWVFDALHLPYGCSVWPAFWTKGPTWPDNGEIDIVEAINLQNSNQMAIHTTDGCILDQSAVMSGAVGFPDCSKDSGCTVRETKANSFGEGFAKNGGGVWATQYDVTGIFIWFWPRPDVPAALNGDAKTLDISSWGPPSAAFPVSPSCNVTKFFTPQQLVIDIALCGVWAGVPDIYRSTCGPGLCSVTGPGSPAYDNAYFEIQHVRAYSVKAPTPTNPPNNDTNNANTNTTTTPPPTETDKPDTNAGTSHTSAAPWWAAALVVAASFLAGAVSVL